MDLTILTIVFLTSNLWGMYHHVPFTNINPTRSFLERAVSSFQITGAIYTLQEMHPIIFPEILQERDAWLNEHPSFPSELDDIIKCAMEKYTASRNITNLSAYRAPTDTSGSNGQFDPHAIGIHLRKCLHPRLESHNGAVKAVWEGLALAFFGFSLLFFVWKENNKTVMDMTPNNQSGDSLATIVQTLLQDRLSLSSSVSRDELVSILNGFMSSITPNITEDIASLKTNMGEITDFLNSIGERIQPGYEAIQGIIENVYNELSSQIEQVNASVACSRLSDDYDNKISITHLYDLISSIDGIIEVQRDISNILVQRAEHEEYGTVACDSGIKSVDESSSQVSSSFLLSHPHYSDIERLIQGLTADFDELQDSLQPVIASSNCVSQLLEDLVERVLSIQLATSLVPFDVEATFRELNRFREKQEALEANINQAILSGSNKVSEMGKHALNANFQSMEERITALEQLIATNSPLDPNKEGSITNVDVLVATIYNLEEANQHLTSRLVIAESNLQKVAHHDAEINRIVKRIVHDGKLFSYATDVKNISLEELAKTFKHHVERFKSETQWLAEQVYPVAEHAARLDRLERSNKGNYAHLLECMKKLGIQFRLDAGDGIEEMLVSMDVKVPANNVVGNIQEERKEETQEELTQADTCAPVVSQKEEKNKEGRKRESPAPEKRSGLGFSRWAAAESVPASPGSKEGSLESSRWAGDQPKQAPSANKNQGLRSSRWASMSEASPAPKKAGLESSKWASTPTTPVPSKTAGLKSSLWAN
ncbi:uncharacterized protein ASPGLDRAFT_61848 [Aspergillus glaucus CBS 516.65]|uniref:Myosin-binding domain-containing protein n=1 Tax=Aspergillus glaucus CBS 516.65 TaxID=1160497 RepID=A0A1L9V672_ASPGL|nr:hypothetical protein ASPGLDRAFT_61848 [Aspergillus glaucus CBS 516.65]OJJ79425.1 hypothetical protein ASPGLDRAFT_61848 [Aspergillus glaucus CBS 516.65]